MFLKKLPRVSQFPLISFSIHYLFIASTDSDQAPTKCQALFLAYYLEKWVLSPDDTNNTETSSFSIAMLLW